MGWVGQGQHLFYQRRFLRSKKRNLAAAEKPSFAFRLRTGKRGRAKIPSPQPPSFLPARAQIFFRIQRPDFRGKKFGFRSAFGAMSGSVWRPRCCQSKSHHFCGGFLFGQQM
jgi:hypothetical protein